MTSNTPITVAYGDGIGPEIMSATLEILKQAGAKISINTVEVGKRIFEQGHNCGINPATWSALKESKILLKGPITTPQGGGYKSLNVTMRKVLGLYANVRPTVAYHPFIKTNHPNLNVVIIRENEEDLYSGIEYRQTHNMYHCLKLISKTGCEKIIRYAFEYALNNNRKKVTCFSKDNIMKMSDGLFHKTFDQIAKQYPAIETDHYIIDIGAARLANSPQDFDVIVTLNLYGDIISDIAAEISGSVGLAGSANIGSKYAMFEAIHGSAPNIAEQNIANPSGLIQASIMLLVHINQPQTAKLIHNAWLTTIEDGIHTKDIYHESVSKQLVGTKEFAQAVIERLSKQPMKFIPVDYKAKLIDDVDTKKVELVKTELKQLVGVDVYFDYLTDQPAALASKINQVTNQQLKLQLISAKGLKVWPNNDEDFAIELADHWRCRFAPNNVEKITTTEQIIYLLNQLMKEQLEFIKIENLYSFDNKLGFSLDQGE